MPFTFAHPAIVLPLTNHRSVHISASGLVIGSITPDFEYFFRMKATGSFSHSLTGAILFDLPIAIFLLVVFHLVVKRPLIENLPDYFQSRLLALRDFDFRENFRKHFAGYIGCLLLGIFSHLFWDSFTHSRTLIVNHFPLLRTAVDYPLLPKLPVYRYVQHISTIAGLVIILLVFHKQVPTTKVAMVQIRPRFWISIAAIAITVFVGRASLGFEYLADVGAVLISSCLAGLVVTSLVVSGLQRKPNS